MLLWPPSPACPPTKLLTAAAGDQTAAEQEPEDAAAAQAAKLVSSPTPVPVMPSYKFTSVALGIRHACGVEAGTERVLCWG